jgi:hypothetical protein
MTLLGVGGIYAGAVPEPTLRRSLARLGKRRQGAASAEATTS